MRVVHLTSLLGMSAGSIYAFELQACLTPQQRSVTYNQQGKSPNELFKLVLDQEDLPSIQSLSANPDVSPQERNKVLQDSAQKGHLAQLRALLHTPENGNQIPDSVHVQHNGWIKNM